MLKLRHETLVVASHNEGKLKEINELISPLGVNAVSAHSLALTDPEETGSTFSANAALKAHAAAKATNLPSLADDSGLAVTALGGDPGIYSARWAEVDGKRDFNFAIDRIEEALRELRTKDFSARFICVLCLALPNGDEALFEGEIRGHLTFPARGDQGFGYDPIFVPEGMKQTFAEMTSEEKKAISHRTDAFRKFQRFCLGEN